MGDGEGVEREQAGEQADEEAENAGNPGPFAARYTFTYRTTDGIASSRALDSLPRRPGSRSPGLGAILRVRAAPPAPLRTIHPLRMS